MAQTARISTRSDQIIREIVSLTGMSKIEVIESALETYRHHERMRLLNESYTQLRSQKTAWKDELKEREELEGTLNDGFEEDL